MANITKEKLSSSDGGRPILIQGTLTSNATNLHSITSNANVYHEVWLYANNFSGSNVTLTLQYGSNIANATNNDRIVYGIPSSSGFTIITPGTVLQGTEFGLRYISAFTNVGNTTTITGYVNNIAP
jgi:hypothetical protein